MKIVMIVSLFTCLYVDSMRAMQPHPSRAKKYAFVAGKIYGNRAQKGGQKANTGRVNSRNQDSDGHTSQQRAHNRKNEVSVQRQQRDRSKRNIQEQHEEAVECPLCFHDFEYNSLQRYSPQCCKAQVCKSCLDTAVFWQNGCPFCRAEQV